MKMKRIQKENSPVSEQTSIGSLSYKEINIEEEFNIVKTLAEGCFAKVILAKKDEEKLVLKAIHSEVSTAEDFNRELHYNYFLSPHPYIVTSYNVSYYWSGCYLLVQEYAPYGDLSRFVKKGGIPESQVKSIAQQLSSALEFIHASHLVHRDMKLENILVFKPNLSLVKICDFGYTRPEGTLVTKTNQTWIPFSPPEICQVVLQERYYCSASSDVWQLGIILYFCLTGSAPWQCADITDNVYCQYREWLRRKSLRMPEQFKPFTPRLLRLFKRILEPKSSKRYGVKEVSKYLKDDWVKRGYSAMRLSRNRDRRESVTPSRQSNRTAKFTVTKNSRTNYQSYVKSQSVRILKSYGLETDIDKTSASERVENWIASSSVTNDEIDTINT